MVKRIIGALPPFPASRGPAAARKAIVAREKYRSKIEALRAELAKADEQFELGFDRADKAKNTKSRIQELAALKTQRRI